MDRSSRSLLAVLSVAALAYPIVPMTDVAAEIWYDIVAVGAIIVAGVALRRHRPAKPLGWRLLLGGLAGWVLGDLTWGFEQQVLHLTTYPAPSDAVYLTSYLALAAGALVMVRTRRQPRDITALLDAAIITVGAAVLLAVFVITPVARDSSLTTFGKLVSSAYPLADLLLLAIVARMWAAPSGRSTSFRLLSLGLAVVLATDLSWALSLIVTADTTYGHLARVISMGWLIGYLLVAAAACVPSMRELAEMHPDVEQTAPSLRRLVALACGLVLPAAVLLLDGTDGVVLSPVIGIGSILLSILVLVRMAGLLQTVQRQAVQLAALARADGLTGAPNRRTWDFELSRACQLSRDNGTPLSVAMIDIDWFKRYNDEHGHQAGDRLLCEAVASWTDQLGGRGMLTRYGGEEFAVLLPGVDVADAVDIIEELLRVTPSGQTFSSGVAPYLAEADPGAAVACADRALYEAKRQGRNRVLACDLRKSAAGDPAATADEADEGAERVPAGS